MEKFMSKRIGQLEFHKAGYLCEEPENPAYQILMYYPNPYYGHEGDYVKNGSHYIARTENGYEYSIHEDCFKHKESCYALGSFDYDDDDMFYEFHFCGDRPIDMPKEMRDIFWELLEYGNNTLNKNIIIEE